MRTYIKILILGVFFSSCQKENQGVHNEIKIGNEATSLSEITINKLTERKILLSGGDEKFRVNIENSKVASASIHQDTLKIKGILEGETFATITSHDQKKQLKVKIIPPIMRISQKEIRLYPQDESKFVSVSGGSDEVAMKVDDPNQAIKVKWNGVTGILEITALQEGDAVITLTSSDGSSESLKIKVRPDGSTEEIGLYTTYRRSYQHTLAPRVVVKRKGVGIWLSAITNPYGVSGTISGVVAKIPPVENPKAGETIDLLVEFKEDFGSSFLFKTGTYSFVIEEVRENTIVLKGNRFKLVLPKL